MLHISHILPHVLRKRGLEEHARASLLVFHAQKWLEDDLPAFAPSLTVLKLEGETLWILSAHSAASQECSLRMSDLLTFLKEKFPHCPLRAIRLTRS